MKTMPMSELPWEAQLVFWVLMVLVSVGFGVALWFLIRHVNGQDKVNQTLADDYRKVGQRIEDIKQVVSDTRMGLYKEITEVNKAVLESRRAMIDELAVAKKSILSDVAEIKQITKTVEGHHSILKAIVVKLQNITIIKGKSE